METTSTVTASSSGIWQRIVLRMLRKMELGRLVLNLPNGQRVELGNGTQGVHAEVQVRDPDFFRRCVLFGDIGFGEAYVDGDWDTPDITGVIKWFLLNVDNAPTISGSNANAWAVNLLRLYNRVFHSQRMNTLRGSQQNISDHYDLNNDFFALFLDPSMTYSSAYFTRPGMSLEEAQYAKYKALCERVELKPTDHVLEIGTGWGGMAIYMAKNYGCDITTTTISNEQFVAAVERVREAGLEDKIHVLLQDYRQLEGQFDKIVSIEMIEAVGHKFLPQYFKQCGALLKKDGLIGLQAITCPDSRYDELRKGVDWIQKHIFPGSLLPSVAALNRAVNKTSDLSLINLEDMGLHYGRTLHHWFEAFNDNWHRISELGFDEAFRRKWNYYLCYCEAAFDMRNISVMQLVYSRPNNLSRA